MEKRSTINYLVSTLITGLTGFILISILTKNFTPTEYGVYSLIITTANLSTMILIGWITQSNIRFFDEYKKVNFHNKVITTSFAIATISNILFIVMCLLSNILFGVNMILVVIIMLLFCSESYYLVANSINRADSRSLNYLINSVCYSAFRIILILVLLRLGYRSIEMIIIVYAFSALVPSLFTFLLYRKYIKINLISMKLFREFTLYGVPLVGFSSVQWIIASSDRYLISYFKDAYEVGIYALAYSLSSNIFTIVRSFLLLNGYPKIIRIFNNSGYNETAREIGAQLKYYYYFTVPLFFGISATSIPILDLLSSDNYTESSNLLIILSLGLFIYGIVFYLNKPWELEKKTKVILYNITIVGLCNILLNILFIPTYGFVAAAYTTVISYTIYFIITYIKSRKIMRIDLHLLTLMKITFSSIIMFLTVKLLLNLFPDNNLFTILVILIGIVTYFSIIILFNEVKKDLTVFFEGERRRF